MDIIERWMVYGAYTGILFFILLMVITYSLEHLYKHKFNVSWFKVVCLLGYLIWFFTMLGLFIGAIIASIN